MCPICVTTTVLMSATATSGVGVIGLIAACRRALHRWLVWNLDRIPTRSAQ